MQFLWFLFWRGSFVQQSAFLIFFYKKAPAPFQQFVHFLDLFAALLVLFPLLFDELFHYFFPEHFCSASRGTSNHHGTKPCRECGELSLVKSIWKMGSPLGSNGLSRVGRAFLLLHLCDISLRKLSQQHSQKAPFLGTGPACCFLLFCLFSVWGCLLEWCTTAWCFVGASDGFADRLEMPNTIRFAEPSSPDVRSKTGCFAQVATRLW